MENMLRCLTCRQMDIKTKTYKMYLITAHINICRAVLVCRSIEVRLKLASNIRILKYGDFYKLIRFFYYLKFGK